MSDLLGSAPGSRFSRRRLISSAAVLGGAAVCAHRWHVAQTAFAQSSPQPVPIPNGDVPGPPTGHFYFPDPGKEPSLIYNFRGLVAVSHYSSPAMDGAGNALILDGDCRAMAGEFMAADGSRQRGAFAFI